MVEVELQIPDSVPSEAVIGIVEQVCASHGLTTTRKGTLMSYPQSVHWHYKSGKQKGTLEITWWERQHRLWFKVAEGRVDEWMDQKLPPLKEQIEKSLL